MKFILGVLMMISYTLSSQNKAMIPTNFKGEHYALYNKCKVAVTFCELTQQSYLSCGSVKNCYGLYVLPGDTFYINIEDKNQVESISADISFGGYFSAINGFVFLPIDINCIPQGALQIVIPLTATIGSSFQVVAQNTSYISSPTFTPGVPQPYTIYVGGQQPQYTFALADYTVCPAAEEVSVKEINRGSNSGFLFPNPTNGHVSVLSNNNMNCEFEVYDLLGNIILNLKQTPLNDIDLSYLNNGIYICRIVTSQKIIASERLVIIK